jgi:hypothetical protein
MENQQFEYNVVEVAVLEERGKQLSGYENAYFPVYRIQEWLKKCTIIVFDEISI